MRKVISIKLSAPRLQIFILKKGNIKIRQVNNHTSILVLTSQKEKRRKKKKRKKKKLSFLAFQDCQNDPTTDKKVLKDNMWLCKLEAENVWLTEMRYLFTQNNKLVYCSRSIYISSNQHAAFAL